MFQFNKFAQYNLSGKIALVVATFGCSGLFKWAPGTVGSLVAAGLSYLSYLYLPLEVLLIAALVCFFGGWYAAAVLKKQDGIKDPGYVVIDEAAAVFFSAYFIFVWASPASGVVLHWTSHPLYLTIANFVVFRFFDIAKPSIIGAYDRNTNSSFGVMFDDVLAALVTIPTVLLITLGLSLL